MKTFVTESGVVCQMMPSEGLHKAIIDFKQHFSDNEAFFVSGMKVSVPKNTEIELKVKNSTLATTAWQEVESEMLKMLVPIGSKIGRKRKIPLSKADIKRLASYVFNGLESSLTPSKKEESRD
jgi:hypothetical protein